MKAVSIVLGILLVIGGVYCLVTPVATYAAIAWIIGIAMIVEGIGSIVTWNDRRRVGFSDGWSLLSAIVSVVLGLVLVGSYVLQYAVSLFIAYLIAIWLVVGGIARIVTALRLRSFYKAHAFGSIGSSWPMLLVIGILVALMGILCVADPVVVMAGVGIVIGISIIVSGASLVAAGLAR